jgi:hypothetical protein
MPTLINRNRFLGEAITEAPGKYWVLVGGVKTYIDLPHFIAVLDGPEEKYQQMAQSLYPKWHKGSSTNYRRFDGFFRDELNRCYIKVT